MFVRQLATWLGGSRMLAHFPCRRRAARQLRPGAWEIAALVLAISVAPIGLAASPDSGGAEQKATESFIAHVKKHGGAAWLDLGRRGRLCVDLSQSDFDDGTVVFLNSAVGIISLTIRGGRITQNGLEKLTCLGELQELGIYGTRLNKNFLSRIYKLEKLVELRLLHAEIQDADLEGISNLNTLRALILEDNPITIIGIRQICRLSGLQVLDISYNSVDRPIIDLITEHLQWLEQLILNHTDVEDGDLQTLARLARLRELHLASTLISDECAAVIGGLRNLHTLVLDNTRVSDGFLTGAQNLSNLQRLYIGKTRITSRGIDRLHEFPALTVLSVRMLAVSNKDVESLIRISKLECVYLTNTTITDSGVMKLIECLPRLGRIGLSGTIVSQKCKRTIRNKKIEIAEDDDIKAE